MFGSLLKVLTTSTQKDNGNSTLWHSGQEGRKLHERVKVSLFTSDQVEEFNGAGCL